MGLFNLLTLFIVAGLLGWQAGRVLAGQGLGLIGNIAMAVAGAVVLQLLAALLGLGGGWFSGLLQAALGAVGALALVPVVKRL